MRTMPEVLKFLEEQVTEMDTFVEEVDCGDDWFCIYGSELGGLQKILAYAKEQVKIQQDFEATMIEKVKNTPTMAELYAALLSDDLDRREHTGCGSTHCPRHLECQLGYWFATAPAGQTHPGYDPRTCNQFQPIMINQVLTIFFKTDTGYNVMFPDYPGCFSVGKTLEEAYQRGEEALALHLREAVD